MVIVLTPAAVRSSWVDKEIEAGVMLERKKRIELIPLDVEPCDVSILLSTYQMVSFRQNYDTALRQLTGILGSITPAPQQKLTCSLCGLPFNRETDLLAHISNWHSFVCPKCGLGFNRQSDMDTHMKNWHSGKR